MKIAISTDHAGFEQLQHLQSFLQQLGHETVNFGPRELNAEDDYPDFIVPAAQAVASGECERGIILGGSGQGEAMVANRVKGVRCALFYAPANAITSIDSEGQHASDEYEILRLSRAHNDANMLSLAARFLDQKTMETAVKIWLECGGVSQERHRRRIKKLDELR